MSATIRIQEDFLSSSCFYDLEVNLFYLMSEGSFLIGLFAFVEISVGCVVSIDLN